jgi:hypothetical protein
MKRLFALAAFVALVLPAQAGAKGFVSLSVCGTDACHTTRDKQELDDAMDSAPQADPGRTGAFFKLRQTIGEPGNEHFPVGREVSFWFPALGVVRGDNGPLSGWTLPTPATQRVLRRLSQSLQPFPAAKLPREAGDPQAAQIAESVGYPRLNHPQSDRDDGGGNGSAWTLSLLAILPVGLLFGLRRRRKS